MEPVTDLTEKLRSKVGTLPSLGYKVAFILDDELSILWDGTVSPASVGGESDMPDDKPVAATLRLSAESFAKLLSGDLDPTLAYMTGKLRVEGSLGVALKINSLLGD